MNFIMMLKRNAKKKGKNALFKKTVKFRDALAEYVGKEMKFRAVLGRKSMTNWKTSGIRQETLELKAIYSWNCPDRLIADHVWVKLDDIINREMVEELINIKTTTVKRIVFTGVVYPYAEPFKGRGFLSYHGLHYSIGNIEINETRPATNIEDIA